MARVSRLHRESRRFESCTAHTGEVPEWTNGTVSKTVEPSRAPRVRIPASPLLPRHSLGEGGLVIFMYYIYSLKCKEGYYIGCTSNLKDRIKRHQKGHIPATTDRLPIKLDFYFALKNKHTAFNFEKYLKSGSGRAFVAKHLT